MIDALAPAASAVSRQVRDGRPLATSSTLLPRRPRQAPPRPPAWRPASAASYLGQRALGVADGGAVAVAIWLPRPRRPPVVKILPKSPRDLFRREARRTFLRFRLERRHAEPASLVSAPGRSRFHCS